MVLSDTNLSPAAAWLVELCCHDMVGAMVVVGAFRRSLQEFSA